MKFGDVLKERLEESMRDEQKAGPFYRELAKLVKDSADKKIIMSLAADEYRHFKELKQLYTKTYPDEDLDLVLKDDSAQPRAEDKKMLEGRRKASYEPGDTLKEKKVGKYLVTIEKIRFEEDGQRGPWMTHVVIWDGREGQSPFSHNRMYQKSEQEFDSITSEEQIEKLLNPRTAAYEYDPDVGDIVQVTWKDGTGKAKAKIVDLTDDGYLVEFLEDAPESGHSKGEARVLQYEEFKELSRAVGAAKRQEMRFDTEARLQIWVSAEEIRSHRDYHRVISAPGDLEEKIVALKDIARDIFSDHLSDINAASLGFSFDIEAEPTGDDINIDRIDWEALVWPELDTDKLEAWLKTIPAEQLEEIAAQVGISPEESFESRDAIIDMILAEAREVDLEDIWRAAITRGDIKTGSLKKELNASIRRSSAKSEIEIDWFEERGECYINVMKDGESIWSIDSRSEGSSPEDVYDFLEDNGIKWGDDDAIISYLEEIGILKTSSKRTAVIQTIDLKKPYTAEEIAEKHGVSVDQINRAFKVGIEIEYEHTKDEEVAKTIASHHLWELANYYDSKIGLPAMEKKLEGEEKKASVKHAATSDPKYAALLDKYQKLGYDMAAGKAGTGWMRYSEGDLEGEDPEDFASRWTETEQWNYEVGEEIRNDLKLDKFEGQRWTEEQMFQFTDLMQAWEHGYINYIKSVEKDDQGPSSKKVKSSSIIALSKVTDFDGLTSMQRRFASVIKVAEVKDTEASRLVECFHDGEKFILCHKYDGQVVIPVGSKYMVVVGSHHVIPFGGGGFVYINSHTGEVSSKDIDEVKQILFPEIIAELRRQGMEFEPDLKKAPEVSKIMEDMFKSTDNYQKAIFDILK